MESDQSSTVYLSSPYLVTIKDVPVSALIDDSANVDEYEALGTVTEYRPTAPWSVEGIEPESDEAREALEAAGVLDAAKGSEVRTDGGDSPDTGAADALSAQQELGYWTEKAEANIDEWGEQDVETLLLAMQEEQGELAQAYLEAEHEGGDHARVAAELDDLAALCIQLRWRLEQL